MATLVWQTINWLQLSGAALNNFQCFFYIKLIALITCFHYSLSFPDVKMTASLHMRFCLINTTKKLFKVAPSKWGDYEQSEILWLEKLTQISPVRTVTNCDMHKSNSGFCTSLNTLGEMKFRSKLRLKATLTNQISLFKIVV